MGKFLYKHVPAAPLKWRLDSFLITFEVYNRFYMVAFLLEVLRVQIGEDPALASRHLSLGKGTFLT